MELCLTVLFASPYTTRSFPQDGQVAQLVERGPEKAGVGGSIPSLATKSFQRLSDSQKALGFSRANKRFHRLLLFIFGAAFVD